MRGDLRLCWMTAYRRVVVCSALIALCAGLAVSESDFGSRLIAAAREQIGVTVQYDGAYRTIPYPNGDVPMNRGVCTDVLIRAYRVLGIDLQRLVHEDMSRAWGDYPKLWGLARPDPSIDHRRVPNLVTFFARHGEVLPVSRAALSYRPGELVTWRLPSGVPHIGIVGNRFTPSGSPLVVHNIGRGAVEEDILFRFTITGHFRYPAGPLPATGRRGSGGEALRRESGVQFADSGG